jgi:Protein of unknown function (DUF2630)
LSGRVAISEGQAMKDLAIFSHISDLIEEEKRIRAQHTASPEDSARLRHLSEELDQCWDLLRQRRALREYGGNEDAATPRDTDVVESYKG